MNGYLFKDAPNYASATFPVPRPFQDSAHEALREGARAGHKNQFVMAPTGAGKLYLGMRVMHEALARGRKAVFVCDRTTLIDQASAKADEYGLSAHGIMQASHWRNNASMPFQIASAQTIARREWPQADVIVIDEAHTMLKVWTKHIPGCDAKVIGLSATPFSPGLGRLFSNLINATTADALTRSGVLVPMRVFSCVKPDMRGAETSGGEWTDRAAAEREIGIIGDVVAEWAKLAENRKTIVFGATIAHCEELCNSFNSAGINAAVFTAETTAEQRAHLLREYRKPDSSLRVLISVEALAKGFDVPDVGCICDCRPLRKSLSTAIQMWGRGLRCSPGTGKTDLLLLDFSGNIGRFAEDYTEIFFNGLDALDAGEKLDKVIREDDKDETLRPCPKCGFTPFKKRCMGCGFEIEKPALVAATAGEMIEVILGKSNKKQAKEAVWQQVCAYARSHSAPDKQAGRAAHLYKDITGVWPRGFTTFEQTPNVPITRDVLNFIKHKNIAYSKRREAA